MVSCRDLLTNKKYLKSLLIFFNIDLLLISKKKQNYSSNLEPFKVLKYITLMYDRLHYLILFLLIFSFFFEGFIATIINYLKLNKAHSQNMTRTCKSALYKGRKVFNKSSLEMDHFQKLKNKLSFIFSRKK